MPSSTEDGSWGGVAAEIVQTTLGQFGKTKQGSEEHRRKLSEIAKARGYRPPSRKGIRHTPEALAKISEASLRNWARSDYRENWIEKRSGENHHFYGQTFSEEYRKKISEGLSGRIVWNKGLQTGPLTEEHRNAIGEGNRGKTMSEEAKAKISVTWTPERKAELSVSMMGENNPAKRPEARAKNSAAKTGENHPMWQGGTSFEPYCPKFNDQLKESIRNRDNRTCVLCGKGEIQNGQRLSVHHITGNKMMGCNGIPWYLCALCRSCNSRPDTVEKEFLIVTGGRSVL